MPIHPIAPLYDQHAHILILGSFPSEKSREVSFYYGHPQNRFWKVLPALFDQPIPQTKEDKAALVLSHHIALWDVIASCDIEKSADSTIRNVIPNDIGRILNTADIRAIFTNGSTAKRYYDRYLLPTTGIEAILLPSTSPANAAKSLPMLIEAWRSAILPHLRSDPTETRS